MKHYLVVVNEDVSDGDHNGLYAYLADDIMHAVEQFQDDPYYVVGVEKVRNFEVIECDDSSHLWNLAAEKRGLT